MRLRSALLTGLVGVTGCGDNGTKPSSEAATSSTLPASSAANSSSVASSADRSPPPLAASSEPGSSAGSGFHTRKRPDPGDGKDADECAFTGGMGMACSNAYAASKDPIVQRYMLRLVEAHASLARLALVADAAAFGGPPHAEIAMGCGEGAACGKDEGYPCLTRAWSELEGGDAKKADASHARACRCDGAGARIPVMAGMGVMGCDGTKPIKYGALSKAEADEILACGTCEKGSGEKACAIEVLRLTTKDVELARYVETTHIPRCKTAP